MELNREYNCKMDENKEKNLSKRDLQILLTNEKKQLNWDYVLFIIRR